MYVSKQVVTVGNWSLISPGNVLASVEHTTQVIPQRGRELGYLYTNTHQSLVKGSLGGEVLILGPFPCTWALVFIRKLSG